MIMYIRVYMSESGNVRVTVCASRMLEALAALVLELHVAVN